VSKDEITFEILVESGAIEFAGVDEDGEMIYNFTNKLKDIAPELFDFAFKSIEFRHYAFMGKRVCYFKSFRR